MMDKKNEILRCAMEQFTRNGFKKTNVASIMKCTTFSTGTFYNYFKSKDSIFMALYIQENRKVKEKIIASVDLEGNPMQVLQKMLRMNYEEMRKNPILKEWYNRDVFSKIEQNYCEEEDLNDLNFLYDLFDEVIKKWQNSNQIRKDIDSEMIIALFSSIILVDTHKDEIGIQYFPQLIDHIANFVMQGLINTSNKE